MATIIKRNARKLTAVGKPMVGYANYSVPGLFQSKHMTMFIGDHILRFEWDDLNGLIEEMQRVKKEHDHL